MRVEFCESPRATLGVEWELALVDPETGDLVSRAPQVLHALRPTNAGVQPRVTHELLLSAVELVTGICENAGEAADDLAESLDAVRAVGSQLGVDLLCAGSHPFARWSDQQVTEGPRYATLIDRTQWWGRQMVIYGVHVHVGIRAAERVLPLLNAMLTYYPHLQALSASSPFWAGLDTGYASNRALMFQQLPTAGLPFQFASWAEYEAYVADMLKTGVIDHYSEIRWDLRPSPGLGTLETRVCDGLPTLAEVAALAALTHCLVVHLDERLDNGEQLPTLPPWHVQENKWRSARYGLDAIIILDDQSNERPVTDDIVELLDRLEPVARRLGCRDELSGIEQILRTGASYQRQRAVAAQHGGDLRAVVAHLVQELREGTAWTPCRLIS
jgi:carboxylate-amine ligase